MRKLVSLCVLLLCLSLPVFAGHMVIGGWCDCGAPGCICDPGETPMGNLSSVPTKPKPNDLGAETLLALAVLLLALRYKA